MEKDYLLEDICKEATETKERSAVKKQIIFITDEEYKRIIDTIRNTTLPASVPGFTKERDEAAYTIIRRTGITPSELVNLEFNDLQTSGDKITYIRIVKKNNEERNMLIDKTISDCIINYMVRYNRTNNQLSIKEGKLFRSENNQKIDSRSIRRRFKQYARTAGLERWEILDLMSLRYVFAKEQIDKGAGVKELCRLLGIKEVRAREMISLLK